MVWVCSIKPTSSTPFASQTRKEKNHLICRPRLFLSGDCDTQCLYSFNCYFMVSGWKSEPRLTHGHEKTKQNVVTDEKMAGFSFDGSNLPFSQIFWDPVSWHLCRLVFVMDNCMDESLSGLPGVVTPTDLSEQNIFQASSSTFQFRRLQTFCVIVKRVTQDASICPRLCVKTAAAGAELSRTAVALLLN